MRDDRGRRGVALARRRHIRQSIPAAGRRGLSIEADRAIPLRQRIVLKSAILLFGAAFLSVPFMNMTGWMPAWVQNLTDLVYVGSALMLLVLGTLYAARFQEAQRRELIRRGYCPACCYRIGQVPSQGDGCVICPECGAAWKTAAD
jgi:hypothetical protein